MKESMKGKGREREKEGKRHRGEKVEREGGSG